MQNIQNYIEHTALKPIVTQEDIENLVSEAKEYQFAGVCVPPYWVRKAKRDVGNAGIKVVTVVGFPLGYHKSEVKLKEIESAMRDGANELDVVVNISAIKTKAFPWVKIEFAQFAQFIHEREGILKVILETAYLTEDELKRTAEVCIDAGVDYLKTSTGFAPEGANAGIVRMLRELAPQSVGIKASGGIQTLAQVKEMIDAGADRIGTSAGKKIMEELQK